mgnify:FL=1|jgi:hypothetical protein|tara:strand:- start:571 stop:2337 length:1767 start_codon:yes stop_codon:yes gene_type:complete
MAVNEDDFKVFSAEHSTNSLTKTGFKSTHYAIGELIDNSIQSALEDKKNKECNIEIIAIDKDEKLSKVIIIDDAGGMSPEILRKSLGVGKGKSIEENKKNRVGLGKTSKFGLGLKQASLSQCKRFEVYTWQSNKTYMSYLDTELMRTGKLEVVPKPEEIELPKEISDITKIKKSNAGTCIIWHDILIDQLRWKTSYGLLRNAEIEFGRMYRHLIQEGNAKIIISSYEEISKGVYKEKSSSEVRKNDPLFLMKNCVVKDHWSNEKQFDYVDEDIFVAPNGSEIKIKYSVANKKFREAAIGSRNVLNSLCGKNSGVSVLRNGRELELNRTFLNQDLRDRFIGVEIWFDGTLDNLMGVDGKKQAATNFYKRDIEELAQDAEKDEIEYLNSIESENSDENLLIKISTSIVTRMNTLLKQVRSYRKGAQTKPGGSGSAETQGTKVANESDVETQADKEWKEKSDAEKIKIIKEQLENSGDENATENAGDIVGKKLRFHFTDVNLMPQILFDIELKAGIYNIKLNKDHPAFLSFFKLLDDLSEEDNEEDSPLKGLKLLLESWARLEDEASDNSREQLQEIRFKWGMLARKFFKN